MIGFLLALAPFAHFFLNIAGAFMSAFGASKEQLAVYQDMVTKQNQAGDLSLESHDRLKEHEAAILARLKAKADAAERKV